MSHSLFGTSRPILTDPEVFEIFQGVLEKWAFLPSADIGPAVDGPADLPLERQVRLSGAVSGTLVVRSSERFGLYLWENVSGGTQSAPHGAPADAFNEFVNLLCGHLMSRMLQVIKGSFDPYLPKFSQPSQWPQGGPQTAIAFLVEDIPVEIRIWVDKTTAPSTHTTGLSN